MTTLEAIVRAHLPRRDRHVEADDRSTSFRIGDHTGRVDVEAGEFSAFAYRVKGDPVRAEAHAPTVPEVVALLRDRYSEALFCAEDLDYSWWMSRARSDVLYECCSSLPGNWVYRTCLPSRHERQVAYFRCGKNLDTLSVFRRGEKWGVLVSVTGRQMMRFAESAPSAAMALRADYLTAMLRERRKLDEEIERWTR